ncbi:MAG: sugar kinase [Clostridia bacterium]|nr:sugar kinase [Clostridia bacterium]
MDKEVLSANPEGKILAIGELLVDLIPAREQMRIEDTGPVLKTASGSAGIFACAAARLGAPVGFIGKVGRDPLSRMVTFAIQKENVDTQCLAVSDEGQIGLAFLEYTENGRNYQYYRTDSVGSRLCAGDLKDSCFAKAFAVHFPGMLLELNESMRGACRRAAELAKKYGVALSFDPNIRQEMIRDEQARKRLMDMVSRADIIAPTLEEGRKITGKNSLGDVLRALRALGPRVIALTMDRDGAALCVGEKVILADAASVQEADPTGAGDTFAAALCVGLREGMEPKRLAMFCNTAGALAVTKRGAIGTALPSRAEVDEMMQANPCRIRETTLPQIG